MGHTFLRLYSDEKIGARHDLLSYAVGFLAVSPPQDSRAMYMVRGLTGQYPGYFEVEPLYVKLGLYNNSESRDLWEQPLNLSEAEVEFLELYLWEFTFNGSIPYFFLDENCSYRLLSLVEVVRPELNLVESLPVIVLPPDTIRAVMRAGLAESPSRYRSSILRKIELRRDRMRPDQRTLFRHLPTDKNLLLKTHDTLVLDALVDQWTYRNYRAQANLPADEKSIFEATLTQRASEPEVSAPIDDEEVRRHFALSPTYLGHATSSATAVLGAANAKESYRMGAHGLIDPPDGYDGIGQIEYLGFDLEQGRPAKWRALLVDAKAIEPIQAIEFKPSWSALIDYVGNGSRSGAHFSGGIGTAANLGSRQAQIYFLPLAEAFLAPSPASSSLFSVGYDFGAYFNSNRFGVLVDYKWLWSRMITRQRVQVEAYLPIRKNLGVKLAANLDQAAIGIKTFF